MYSCSIKFGLPDRVSDTYINHLSLSILQTVAYFDHADFPLTKEELYRYLWQPPSGGYEDFLTNLDGLVIRSRDSLHPASLSKIITSKWSYYFFNGREEIVEARRRSVVLTDLKLKKAQRALRYISWLPFLEALFISSSVAAETAHQESDIDCFIIAKPGRIWLVRFGANLILRLMGMRIYGMKREDRLCLCFFVDTDHLDLSPWCITSEDIHFIYWLLQMLPVFDPKDVYSKFLAANEWVYEYVPHMRQTYSSRLQQKQVVKTFFEKILSGSLGDFFEKIAKKIQWFKLKPSLKEKSLLDTKEVVIREGVLKFHEHDTRQEIKERWLEVVKNL